MAFNLVTSALCEALESAAFSDGTLDSVHNSLECLANDIHRGQPRAQMHIFNGILRICAHESGHSAYTAYVLRRKS